MPPNTNCPRCGSQYDTDKDRDRHVSNTRFCNDCQKCYASSQQANHFRTHQTSATISVHGQKLVIERSTPADRWACPLCPADAPCSYTETSNLTRHLRTRHDAAPTPHHAAAEQNPDSELDIGAFILQAERNARAKQQELADLVIATDNTADNNPWLDRSRALHILEGCRLPALARQGEGVKAAPIVVTLRTAVNDLWRWGVAAYQGMGADEEGGPMPGLSGHSFDRIMRSGASDAPPGGSTFMPRNPLNYAVYLRLLVSTLGADRVQRESGQPSGSSVTAPARSFDPCFTDAQQLAFDALFLQAQEPLPSSADSVTDEDKPKASQLALRLIDFVVSLIEEPLPSVPDRSALVRCTALMSINQSRGCYYDGPAVSSRLAGWVWCLRFCWILKQLYMHRHRASADWLAVIDTIAASRKRVLVDLTPYPMSVILSQEAYAIKLAWNSTGRAHFTWAADGQSLTFRGTDTLTMTHMRDFVHEQIDSTHRWLAEKLFLCTPEELPPSRRRDIKDNLYFEGAGGGYSFVTEPANAELWDKMWIVRRMRTASELQHRYVSTEHDSGWNILSLSDWLRKAQDGLEQLAVLLLWTGGQAPRGTELVTVRTSNTVIGARDLYVRDGQVFYTTAYNKSQRRTGNRMVIPRALPDAVGELVILWMVYVRSAQQVFHLAQNNTAMSVTLFADGQHRSWTFRKLSEAVSRITSDALGIQLHYHDLRQMFVFIANRHLRAKPDKHANSVLQSLDLEDREDGEDEGGEGRGSSRQEDAMHLQAGHSGRTGRMHYGLDVDQLRALSNEAVEVMWSVSRQRPSPLIVMLIAAMCVNSAVSAEWHTFLNLATRIEIGVVAPWDTVGRTTVQKRVLPVEESSSQQTGSETANEASFPSIKHRRIEIVPEPMFGQGLSATMMTSLISLYGTSYRARSPMQAAALGAIDCRATPLLVILGTGRGKSTLFLAQAKRTDAKTSVVVVPFVSLMQDLLRTCRSRGIHTEDFSSEMMGQPQLVLVSADRFFSPRFSEWWSHMASRQQLDWLFFDECHVLLTQSTFREQLQQFNGLFNLNIRLCLLTATLPPSLETVYRRRLALPAWTLLREETNRANLRYEVTLHADSKGVAGSVRETVKVFRSTVERRPAERCIIYVRDLKAGNALSKVLGVPFYYGGDPTAQEERRDKFEEWRDGKHTCIVATSAFGQGIDYPSVTLLIHCGMPWDMESFVQESGRAGRDGSAARCNLFTTNKTTTQTAFEDEGNRALHAMVYNSQHCRRLAISQYMDGVGVECIALPGSELCDVCQERMTTFAATTVAPRIPLPKAPEGSKPIEPASVAPIQAQDMLQPPTSSSWPAAPTTASPRPSSLPAHQQMRRTQGQQNHALANQLERIRSACMICYGVSGCNDASLPSIQHSYTQCKVNRLQARHVFAIKKQIQYSNARNMCFRCSTTSALCGADRGHRFQDMAIPLLLAVAEDPDRLAHYARRMGCALPGHNGMPEWLGATMRDEHGRDSTRAAVFLSLVLAE